ncbi:MAG: ferrochelatase [Planctomycetes bacterium]|nr:ferrochelatase [Planctomycetota bacterium]
MSTPREGLLLVNLGTPAAPKAGPVRKYLSEFLSDPRVLTVPSAVRYPLLATILLRRPAESAKAYQKVWDPERGSPLLHHGEDLAKAVQEKVGPDVRVELAMRYQEPSLQDALKRYNEAGINRITVFPLFPHYASSSWGSAAQRIFELAGAFNVVPSLSFVPPYYDHPAFIEAWAAVAGPRLEAAKADKVLLSFHGLPESHMQDSDPTKAHCLAREDCCAAIVPANRGCYRAQCYATARALAKRLGLAKDAYEVCFQSRLGRTPWIKPYTDLRVNALADDGVKRLAVVLPAFVADCLETLEEIGMRAREDFQARGGEELTMVPSLNSDPAWVDAVVELSKLAGLGAFSHSGS